MIINTGFATRLLVGGLLPAMSCSVACAWVCAFACAYVHTDLTPYQLVGDNGQCLTATASTDPAMGWIPKIAPCANVSYQQKFYLLDHPTPTDFVPQVDPQRTLTGWNARIVLASEFNSGPKAGYSYIYMPTPGTISGSTTHQPGTAPYISVWRISRTNVNDTWEVVANEGQSFYFTGPGTRQVRYGANSSVDRQDRDAFAHGRDHEVVECPQTTPPSVIDLRHAEDMPGADGRGAGHADASGHRDVLLGPLGPVLHDTASFCMASGTATASTPSSAAIPPTRRTLCGRCNLPPAISSPE